MKILLSFLLILTQVFVHAQLKLTAVVKDAKSDTAIRGIKVEIFKRDTSNSQPSIPVGSAVSNQNGEIFFNDLAKAHYSLFISGVGYESKRLSTPSLLKSIAITINLNNVSEQQKKVDDMPGFFRRTINAVKRVFGWRQNA